jgi:hypothetical protein
MPNRSSVLLALVTGLIYKPRPASPEWTERVFNRERNCFTYCQLRAKYVVFAESNLSALQGALKVDTKALMAALGPAASAAFASKVGSSQRPVCRPSACDLRWTIASTPIATRS